jgi:hypothetical protein
LQRNNHATLQRNNHAILQYTNHATLQRNNHATLQRNNHSRLRSELDGAQPVQVVMGSNKGLNIYQTMNNLQLFYQIIQIIFY